jgi:hypothetical protein
VEAGTNVSEKHIASIFWSTLKVRREPACLSTLPYSTYAPTCFTLPTVPHLRAYLTYLRISLPYISYYTIPTLSYRNYISTLPYPPTLSYLRTVPTVPTCLPYRTVSTFLSYRTYVRRKSASEEPARARANRLMWSRVKPDFLLFSSTLKMEAIRSSEMSVNTISTRRHIPEDCFLHRHSRENLKSYTGKSIVVSIFN